MGKNQDKAFNLFSASIKRGELLEHGVAERHIERGIGIKQNSENEFTMSIERHPHLFGMHSFGKRSSAFATVEQFFLVDTKLKSIKFIDEKLIDIDISYVPLAEELIGDEFDNTWLDENEKEQLTKFESQEEVTAFAKKLHKKINWKGIIETLCVSDYDLPPDFYQHLENEIKK